MNKNNILIGLIMFLSAVTSLGAMDNQQKSKVESQSTLSNNQSLGAATAAASNNLANVAAIVESFTQPPLTLKTEQDKVIEHKVIFLRPKKYWHSPTKIYQVAHDPQKNSCSIAHEEGLIDWNYDKNMIDVLEQGKLFKADLNEKNHYYYNRKGGVLNLEHHPLFLHIPHDESILDIVKSPNGKLLVITSTDGNAYVFDVATKSLLARLDFRRYVMRNDFRDVDWQKKGTVSPKGYGDWVISASFSPDSKRVVTGSLDGHAIVWDLSSLNR